MLLQRRSASRAIPANERRAVPHAAARTLGADKKSHGFNVRQRQFVEIQRGGTTTVREFGARMLDVLGPHLTRRDESFYPFFGVRDDPEGHTRQ